MTTIVTDAALPLVSMPLSAAETAAIDHEITHYPQRQAATIEALKIVQEHQGWVSDGKLVAIAEHLGVHPSEVESVATFYNRIYRKPVAENVFLICDSVSCWMMGQPELMAQAADILGIQPGGTSGAITLIPTPCLGACDQAPVMMINDQRIEKLTPEKLTALIAQHRTGTGMHSGEARS